MPLISVLFLMQNLQIFDVREEEPQVPCYFIFGDSLADNGNNNYRLTLAKSNYPPYGVDFPEGPTGRFTNDRLIVDIIAQLLGFEDFIPPFANLTGKDVLKGVDYASAASGILNETGTHLGDIISMNEQLENHLTTVSKIVRVLKDESAAKEYLGKCIYTIITGNDDYINNYFMPSYYNSSKVYSPRQFADVLAKQFSKQLETLYSYGARKVAIFGIGLIGEVPEMIARFGANSTAVEAAAGLLNKKLLPLIDNLNSQLTGAKFTYINTSGISITINATADHLDSTDPCCRMVPGEGTCVPGSIPCANRTEYAFYDGFHTTDVVNVIVAGRAYRKELSIDASPYDIYDLTQLK
ncbi:hypothetical protein CDL15_Pgr027094 [Punica granatum]|uniref:GDSL esterase/lipase At1g29670-like n=1 Tax=Punica granatum TaxID=22663 RepID=A0A218XGH1_PUNGR|nr:hypothetical protein CDL15_Pgr027094 [Punica granatum]